MKRTSPSSPPPERAFSPPAFFANKDRMSRLCATAAIFSSLTTLLCLILIFRFATQSPLILGVDRAGIPFGERGTSFSEAKELHAEQALLATTALLSRSPTDFDLPEILQPLFSGAALDMAKELKSRENAEFQEKAISQKPQVARVEALETRPDLVLVVVTGKLARNGSLRNQPFVEVVPFTLHLSLKLNSDLLRNKRYPTVVSQFVLRYE